MQTASAQNTVPVTGNSSTDPLFAFGPVAHKSIGEMIGETFQVVAGHYSLETKAFFIKRLDAPEKAILNKDVQGKLLTLIRFIVNDKYNSDSVGVFKGNDGIEYTYTVYKNRFPGLVYINDIADARKLLLNNTYWLNLGTVYQYNAQQDRNDTVKVDRFTPVLVTGVELNWDFNKPVKVSVKTPSGITGFMQLDVSGNCTNHGDSWSYFNEAVYTTNPKLTYHFTPAVWQAVVHKNIILGMPGDAVVLVENSKPNVVNRSVRAGKTEEQWVFVSPGGFRSYYYFTNGKLTSWND